MAKLRQLGNLAELFLRHRLNQLENERQNEMIGERQTSQAYIDNHFNNQELAETRRNELIKLAANNPAIAQRLAREDPSYGVFTPTEAQMDEPVAKGIDAANTEFELPTAEGIINQRRGQGTIENLHGVSSLLAQRNARSAEFGKQREAELDRGFAQNFGNAFNTGMGTEQATAQNFPAALERDRQTGVQSNALKLDFERDMIPIAARRAGAETGARLAAEWKDPSVIAAKLDFETQKATQELAMAGRRAEAQGLAEKAVSVKQILPIYQQYREIATNIMTDPEINQNPAYRQGLITTVSKLPWIGEASANFLETAQAAEPNLFGNPQLAQQLSKLNALTESLAQGMANAVIGNKGPTSENDRRTAKSVLVTVFTHAQTAQDLIDITDRMFSLLPTVSTEMEGASPSEIILEARRRAGAPAEQSTTPTNTVPGSVQSILNR